MSTPFPSHAQAVVIGGGLVGCSILYHLCKLGWKDVILLERDELTSGSTWHAAANLHGLHDNNNISKLQYYTMKLYKELEAETGQGCGVFQPGLALSRPNHGPRTPVPPAMRQGQTIRRRIL